MNSWQHVLLLWLGFETVGPATLLERPQPNSARQIASTAWPGFRPAAPAARSAGAPETVKATHAAFGGLRSGCDESHLLILTAALRVRRIALRVCLARAPGRGVGRVAGYPARGGLGAAAYSAFLAGERQKSG